MQAGYSAQAALGLLLTYIILGDQMPNASQAKSNLEARAVQIRAVASAIRIPAPISEKTLGLP